MAYIGRTTDGFGVRQRFLFTPDAGATSVMTSLQLPIWSVLQVVVRLVVMLH
jgi:hypothetical protein